MYIYIMQMEKHLEAHCNSATYYPFPILPVAQVDVLSAALRASSLDAHEEASDPEKKSDVQDELGVSEQPNCKMNRDASVPLISDAVEVTNSVKCLSSESSLNHKCFVGE